MKKLFVMSVGLLVLGGSTYTLASTPGTSKEKIQKQEIAFDSLPVEFRGGRKAAVGGSDVNASITDPAIAATGSVYVAIDAGHGKGYGSECPNGCYTGVQRTGYNEDEMNRKVAQQLYARLDPGTTFFPAVSRWVQNNDRDVADWDSLSGASPESGDYAIDHMFTDNVPYTSNPDTDTTWSLNGCEGQPSSCKDNKRATLYAEPVKHFETGRFCF